MAEFDQNISYFTNYWCFNFVSQLSIEMSSRSLQQLLRKFTQHDASVDCTCSSHSALSCLPLSFNTIL